MDTLCVENVLLPTKYGRVLKKDVLAKLAKRTRITEAEALRFAPNGCNLKISWQIWENAQKGFVLNELTTTKGTALKIAFGPIGRSKRKTEEILNLLKHLVKNKLYLSGLQKLGFPITPFILGCVGAKQRKKRFVFNPSSANIRISLSFRLRPTPPKKLWQQLPVRKAP